MLELWLAIMAESWPNTSPKGFQVDSNIEILCVTCRTEEYWIFTVSLLQAAQVTMLECLLPFYFISACA